VTFCVRRADTIRVQSQRRSNAGLAKEPDSAPKQDKEQEKQSFGSVEELFSFPTNVKAKLASKVPTPKLDTFLHKAMVRKLRLASFF
jgi:hypothetical protein